MFVREKKTETKQNLKKKTNGILASNYFILIAKWLFVWKGSSYWGVFVRDRTSDFFAIFNSHELPFERIESITV